MGAQATRLTGCSVHHPRTGAPEGGAPAPTEVACSARRAHGSRPPPPLAPAPGTAPPRGALRLFLVGPPSHGTAKQEAIGPVRRVLPRLLAPGRPIGNGERERRSGLQQPTHTPHHC